jgi:subtilase family serine protease
MVKLTMCLSVKACSFALCQSHRTKYYIKQFYKMSSKTRDISLPSSSSSHYPLSLWVEHP